MKIKYVERRFAPATLGLISSANTIIAEYQADGYALTLRQLYYQFVSRDMLANTQKSYDRLGSAINDARLAGLVDWLSIEDRTRGVVEQSHWGSPEDVIAAAAAGYARNKWEGQPCHVEVWVEKEALAGVFERICEELDVSWLACRGYVSQSEMWRAARRLLLHEKSLRRTIILHFGDHDPSGIDMTRDIQERLAMFGSSASVLRMALNFDQVEQYSPPPNPAKATDSRFEEYRERFGDESWELDALEPRVLVSLVREGITSVLQTQLWDSAVAREAREKQLLERAADQWGDIAERLSDAPKDE